MFLVTVTNRVQGVGGKPEFVDTRFVFDTREQAGVFVEARKREGLSASIVEWQQPQYVGVSS